MRARRLTTAPPAAQPWWMSNNRAVVKRILLISVILVAVIAVLAGVWLFRAHGGDVHVWMDRGLAWVRGVGPVAFFGLMAVLPGLGCPLSIFSLSAGPVFGPVMGVPTVIALASLSLAIKISLTYCLARWVLRPWIERLCVWLDYRLPVVPPVDYRGLVILVRVTPGSPFVFQNYLLGLAAIPFGTYFVISWVVSTLYACAFILFGNALMEGKGRVVLMAVSLFVALTVAVQLIRKHYAKRKVL